MMVAISLAWAGGPAIVMVRNIAVWRFLCEGFLCCVKCEDSFCYWERGDSCCVLRFFVVKALTVVGVLFSCFGVLEVDITT